MTYDLAPAGTGTTLAVAAHTSTDGLPKAAARMGTRSDAASLRRSLDRLAVRAAGAHQDLLSRVGDSNHAGQAL